MVQPLGKLPCRFDPSASGQQPLMTLTRQSWLFLCPYSFVCSATAWDHTTALKWWRVLSLTHPPKRIVWHQPTVECSCTILALPPVIEPCLFYDFPLWYSLFRLQCFSKPSFCLCNKISCEFGSMPVLLYWLDFVSKNSKYKYSNMLKQVQRSLKIRNEIFRFALSTEYRIYIFASLIM